MPESSDDKFDSTAQSGEQPQSAPSAPTPADPNIEDAERKRKLQSLQLQRERILSERTSNPHRRTALTNALADIEEKLAELGWSIQLYP